MGDVVDLGNMNGQSMKGAVVLGREFRITLDRQHQAVLEQVARFNGVSPRDYLQHAAEWVIKKAHYEIACAIAVGSFLARFPLCN